MSAPKYCDDPDHCTYSDCPTAFCDRGAKHSFAAPPLLAECVEYTKTLVECQRVSTVADMLENTAYVYLGRKERLALAWRILKTIFR